MRVCCTRQLNSADTTLRLRGLGSIRHVAPRENADDKMRVARAGVARRCVALSPRCRVLWLASRSRSSEVGDLTSSLSRDRPSPRINTAPHDEHHRLGVAGQRRAPITAGAQRAAAHPGADTRIEVELVRRSGSRTRSHGPRAGTTLHACCRPRSSAAYIDRGAGALGLRLARAQAEAARRGHSISLAKQEFSTRPSYSAHANLAVE